jgi:membrane protease YdiL (CAAX protease family)
MPTDIKTRMRLVLVGWLLGSAVVVGLAVVEPAWLPLEDHAAVCGVMAGLAGIAVVFALYRWRPQALPAWVLSPGGGR